MNESKVLALKYRPKKLNDLIGQDIVAKTIFNSIKKIKKSQMLIYFTEYEEQVKLQLLVLLQKVLIAKME